MAHPSAGLDFSKEDWDIPVQFSEGCWVIAHRHSPALNPALELNNRTFVFRLNDAKSQPTLLVFGHADAPAIEAVKKLEQETGLSVTWIVGNGGGHHLFLELWYEAFPEARILVPAKRVPFTENGKRLAEKYADRWELMHGPRPEQIAQEFGDQIELAIFDQLFVYKDETSVALGMAKDHRSPRTRVGGFKLMGVMMKQMKDLSQPNDEVFLFHRASGLAIAGHNFQLSYVPKGFSPPAKFTMRQGGFPMSLMMKMMMPKGAFKSMLEGMPGPIADPKVHAETWKTVLDWPFNAWTSAHDPPTVCGPDVEAPEIKDMIRASLQRTGEDDPTGARLKWNIKHAS